MSKIFNRCRNPSDEAKHLPQLRFVSEKMKARFPNLQDKDKICDSCRLKFDAKIEEDNVLSMEESREIISNLLKLFNDENLAKN